MGLDKVCALPLDRAESPVSLMVKAVFLHFHF